MLSKDVLKGLSAYKPGMHISEVQKKYNLDRIIKLASNENPYGFSPKLKEKLPSLTTDYEFYPDGYAYDLRLKVAKKYNVTEDQLVFGAGSDEIITFICRAYCYEGTNTVMATPTFTQYRHHALIQGAEIREVPTINGKHDLTSMLEEIDDKTSVVWLCTPDNPSGELIDKKSFDSFMEQCPSHVLVVLDEAYVEYVDETMQLPLNENLKTYPNLVVLRTFSKCYGLAGLRVGYGLMSEKIAEKLNVIRGPFNTSSWAQRAAAIALDDEKFIKETREKNEEVKRSFMTFLDSIGWTYNESHTNFLLVHVPIDADKASHYLLTHGFIVRSGNLLGYPNTMRITLGTKADMDELQHVITKLKKEIDTGVIK